MVKQTRMGQVEGIQGYEHGAEESYLPAQQLADKEV
jgi:hypothetical protein